MSPILETKELAMHFNGLIAVHNFNMRLKPGVIYGLIGTNGAGKTTVFNMLTGVLKPTSGKIILAGKDITGLRPDKIVSRGIARTFQNLRLFSRLRVIDNVMIGAQLYKEYNFFSSFLSLPSLGRGEQKLKNWSMELLDVLGLSKYADKMAGNLPYGSQRRLEIARAIATRPCVLLLDEPAAGMNPQESQDLMETIRNIRKQYDLSILLIEHDMRFVMNICDDIQVLGYGRMIAEGKPEEITNNPEVIEEYLGRAAANV